MRFPFASLLIYLLAAVLAPVSKASSLQVRAPATGSNKIVTYPVPTGVSVANSFEVKIRTPGGKWQNVTTYQPTVAQINTTTGSRAVFASSMAYFDFNGTVEISATYSKARVEEARVRPDSLDIAPNKSGHTVKFKLSRPQNVVLQVNGEVFDCLHLFTNPISTETPSSDDPDVIYFGPGFHSLAEALEVPSGKTVYVAGGAVVSVPSIYITNVTSAAVRGHGVLTSTRSGSISITRSKNVVIDGLIGLNFMARTFESSNVEIRNWRSFSSVQWGDGIDLFCSKDILIDSVFLRNSDDCLAIYNHRDSWYGDSKNITLQNSSLWADVAHPINVATHGNTLDPETVDGFTVRNIDILDHREKQMLYQGAIAINPGDSNLVQNVLIDDVRVEDFRMGQLLNFRVMFNEKYNTSPGRGIRNVLIQNLKYNGNHAGTSIFTGYDADRTISNVTFHNLTINGQAISDSMKKPSWYLTTDFIPMYANEHVSNLTFIA
ncbi:pectin lyase fold/virulence factor [Dactylonectria macrodidyma]|uniref:Pectin lyase fold/virulence factor n=1 Tax=Dactylonectria macrodidyma TaxID=307937 RepID=A0A9P9JS71_9HYPO|nr:pectin lyase fold/virulence factor [Dactylonectria macrodidyma]